MMEIRELMESDWKDLMELQYRSFREDLAEGEEVLRPKWSSAPDCCFVARDDDGRLLGYIIAHPWKGEAAPALSEETAPPTLGEYLFVHDCSVDSSARGMGLGAKLSARVAEAARCKDYREIRLVSVQDSASFWRKQGYRELPSEDVVKKYGPGSLFMMKMLT